MGIRNIIAASLYEQDLRNRSTQDTIISVGITSDILLMIATMEVLNKVGNTKHSEKELYYLFNEAYHQAANNHANLIYGSNFRKWFEKPLKEAEPYNSYSIGSLIRMLPILYKFQNSVEYNVDDILSIAYTSSFPTHNHPFVLSAIKKFIYYVLYADSIIRKEMALEAQNMTIEGLSWQANIFTSKIIEEAYKIESNALKEHQNIADVNVFITEQILKCTKQYEYILNGMITLLVAILDLRLKNLFTFEEDYDIINIVPEKERKILLEFEECCNV